MKWLRLISLLLPVLFLSACRRELPDSSATAGLSITLEFPATAMVKSSDQEIPASQAENAIHDLKIWVFKSAAEADKLTHKLVARLELDSNSDADDFPRGGAVKRYVLPIEYEMFAAERPDVDVFVLANASSIGLDGQNGLTLDSSWADVRNAVFGGAYFAPGADAVHSVSGNGLPMSACGTGLAIQGEDPSLSVATVQLRRCVSRLQFFFCQTSTEGEVVNITGMELYANQIAASEYVFSEDGEASLASGGYVNVKTELTGTGEIIRKSDAPEKYVYKGQDGVTYQQLLDYGVKSVEEGGVAELTDGGTLYLRESDLPLKGKIYYTVTKEDVTESKEAEFYMANSGDFARNHCWIVYGYFVSDRILELSVAVQAWDMNKYSINFSDASLVVTQKLSVVPESVGSIDPVEGMKNHFTVTLKPGKTARAYLNVSTPEYGWLLVQPMGDRSYFEVEPEEEVQIQPKVNMGRIDIAIRQIKYEESTGKSITLSFKAFTADKERTIAGGEECIDQVYHFTLP